MTDGLICPERFIPAPSTMASFEDSSQFPWMEVALKEFHTSGVTGSVHNPRIVEYHSACRGNATDDETAWCSSFTNWVMREIGITGTERGNARSWRNWGNAVSLRPYPVARLLDFRWPPGFPPPNMSVPV